MGRKYEMSWDGPKKRWVKMFGGVRYRVQAEDLPGVEIPTAEGSYRQANEWWRAKLAELTGPTPLERVVNDIKTIAATGSMNDSKRKADAADWVVKGLGIDDPRKAADKMLGLLAPTPVDPASDMARVELLTQLRRLEDLPAPQDRRLGVVVDRFLAVENKKGKPLTFREIRQVMTLWKNFGTLTTESMDVGKIDENLVEALYLQLRNAELAASVKKKRWDFFKRFCRYLWSRRLIDSRATCTT